MPKLKALWESYHDVYDVDVIVVPTLPTTARPINDAEPYFTHNGRKVRLWPHCMRLMRRRLACACPSDH